MEKNISDKVEDAAAKWALKSIIINKDKGIEVLVSGILKRIVPHQEYVTLFIGDHFLLKEEQLTFRSNKEVPDLTRYINCLIIYGSFLLGNTQQTNIKLVCEFNEIKHLSFIYSKD